MTVVCLFVFVSLSDAVFKWADVSGKNINFETVVAVAVVIDDDTAVSI